MDDKPAPLSQTALAAKELGDAIDALCATPQHPNAVIFALARMKIAYKVMNESLPATGRRISHE